MCGTLISQTGLRYVCGFVYVAPPVYEQALDVSGSVLLSASGGKCGNFMTVRSWLYSGIVVVCVP